MSIRSSLRMLFVNSIITTNAFFGYALNAQDSYSAFPADSQRVMKGQRPNNSAVRNSKLYLAFSIATGLNSFSSHASTLQTGFPCTSSVQPQAALYGGNRLVPAVSSPSQVFTIGLEVGRWTGSVYGFDFSFTNTNLPEARNGLSNHIFDFRYGYNFSIARNVWIRPSALLGISYLHVPFEEEIDNNNVDLYAFGNTFPYKSKYRSGSSSHYIYNSSTSVNLYEFAVLPKLQLDLNWQVTRVLAFTVSGGYRFTWDKTDKIEVANRSNRVSVPFSTTNLTFTSTLPTKDIFNYSGPYLNVGLMLRFRNR